MDSELYNVNEADVDPQLLNEFKDNFATFPWDGPENPDEEIEEMAKLKNNYEIEQGIRFSRDDLVNYIEQMFRDESIEA